MKTQSTPKKRPKFSEWHPKFIEALREFGVVSYSAEVAGVERTAVYKARHRNAKFAAEWDEALAEATEKLEFEGRRRAYDGVQRIKFHKGEPIMVPLIDGDGRPVYEDDIDEDGNIIFDKRGQPKQRIVMVPYVEHEYSDTLLIFLLKNWNKEKYGDKMKLSTEGGQPLVAQTINNFPNLSDDELYDAFTGAMAKIATLTNGDDGKASPGTGAAAA